MTLSDLQAHSLTTSLFKYDFSHSCAAVDKCSTDTALRVVPVQQWNLL